MKKSYATPLPKERYRRYVGIHVGKVGIRLGRVGERRERRVAGRSEGSRA